MESGENTIYPWAAESLHFVSDFENILELLDKHNMRGYKL